MRCKLMNRRPVLLVELLLNNLRLRRTYQRGRPFYGCEKSVGASKVMSLVFERANLRRRYDRRNFGTSLPFCREIRASFTLQLRTASSISRKTLAQAPAPR